MQQIKSQIHAIDADIVFLQEIQGEHRLKCHQYKDWPDDSQFEYLADAIWPHHAYAKNAIYDAGHHGNAILSKYPFVRWENINLSFLKSASRSLLHGVLMLDERDSVVHVICVHLGLFEFERRQQLGSLVKRIQDTVPEDEPLIIAGDFNDWLGKSNHFLERSLGVHEVFKRHSGKSARTFPSWLPILSVDRIYSRGLTLTAHQRLHGSQWRALSDHLPLLAEFSIT